MCGMYTTVIIGSRRTPDITVDVGRVVFRTRKCLFTAVFADSVPQFFWENQCDQYPHTLKYNNNICQYVSEKNRSWERERERE